MRMVTLLVLAAALAACGGPSGRRLTAEEYLELERATNPGHQASEAAGVAAPAAEASSTGRFTSREASQPGTSSALPSGPSTLAAEPGAVERQLAEIEARLRVLGLERDLAADETRLARERAERRLRHAREDLAHFEQLELQRRLKEDALALAEAEDALDELREELGHLESLYGVARPEGLEADLLERLRRRVQRAADRRELALGRSQDLRERVLPRELESLRTAVDEAEHEISVVERRSAAEAEQRALRALALEADQLRLRALLDA